MRPSSPQQPASRVPDLLLEQLHLHELDAATATNVRARLAAEPDGLTRLAALGGSDSAVFAAFPPAEVAAEITRRQHLAAVRGAHASDAPQGMATPSSFASSLRWLAAPLVATLAIALFVALPDAPAPAEVEPALLPANAASDRAKGGVSGPATGTVKLLMFRKNADGAGPLADGAVARAGDLVQVGYFAQHASFVTILSIDGRGRVTLHLPADKTGTSHGRPRGAPLGDQPGTQHTAHRAEVGQSVMLDHAYELDDAPTFERFVLVSSPSPFAVRDVQRAARLVAASKAPSSARLALAAGMAQTSFVLSKVDGQQPNTQHPNTRHERGQPRNDLPRNDLPRSPQP